MEQGGQTRAWGWEKAMGQGRPQGLSSSLILPDGAIGIDVRYLIESSEDESAGS